MDGTFAFILLALGAAGVAVLVHHLDPAWTVKGWLGGLKHGQAGIPAPRWPPPWLPGALQDALGAALLLGAALVLLAAWRLYQRQLQAWEIRAVRLLLSRDDVAQPLTVAALFDAWAETVGNRYVARLMGNDPVALDLLRDEGGRLLLYLRGAAPTVNALTSRLRATWTNVRTVSETAPEVVGPVAAVVTPRYRNTVTRGFRSYRDYSHSVTESIFAVLDEATGPAQVQFVLSPRGFRFAARAERAQHRFEARAKNRGQVDTTQLAGMGIGETAQIQAVAKTAGRQWWRTEIRMVTQDVSTLQALVGALNEAAAENVWQYHRVWWAPVRRRFDSWRHGGMPGVWPVLGCTSLPGIFLATLWQIPSARLRVSGLLREQTRRGPALLSVPTEADGVRGVTPIRDEAGRTVVVPAKDLRWNTLCTGSQGAGKSTVLQQFWRFAATDREWAGVLIDPKGALADAARALVPPDRPCVTWRLGQPSEWGYNPFLGSDDWDLGADRLLGAMKQAWTDGSILARSEDILRHACAAVFDLGQQHRGFVAAREILEAPAGWGNLAKRIHSPDLAAWFSRWAGEYKADTKGVQAALAAPLNKLSALTFGARRSAATCSAVSIDLERIIADRGLLIVNLATDEMGEDSAALVGILLLAGLWNALRGASAAAGGEVPTLLILDEAHRFLGETFFRLVAEGRAFGAAAALGLQFVGQIADERAQATVRELVQHRFLFRSQNVEEAEAEAKLLARIYSNFISPDQELQDIMSFTPDDLFNLPSYRCVARVLVGGKPQPAFLGETIPLQGEGTEQPWGVCPPEWLHRATLPPEEVTGDDSREATEGHPPEAPPDASPEVTGEGPLPELAAALGVPPEDLQAARDAAGDVAVEAALRNLATLPTGRVRAKGRWLKATASKMARGEGE